MRFFGLVLAIVCVGAVAFPLGDATDFAVWSAFACGALFAIGVVIGLLMGKGRRDDIWGRSREP